jgi:hypothetical protein
MPGQNGRCGNLIYPYRQIEEQLVLYSPLRRGTAITIKSVVPVAVTIPVEPDVDPKVDVRIDNSDKIVKRGPAAVGQIERENNTIIAMVMVRPVR